MLPLVLAHSAYEYQVRRRNDKIYENQRRLQILETQPVDITPTNAEGRFLWSKAQDLNQFEEEWNMKPVKVHGIFDHSKEIQVVKQLNGEPGVDIITPFFTHLNAKGEECGILVNRGWVPYDLKDQKMHYTGVTSGNIVGVLYRGDNKTKYTLPNEPTINRFTRVDPYDLALMMQMKNREEAGQFMLQQIDTDDQTRQLLPSTYHPYDLVNWRVKPERHEAYAALWKYMTFIGLFANATIWLYF